MRIAIGMVAMISEARVKTVIIALLSFTAFAAHGQAPAKACDTPESRQMDFWIGDWEARYTLNGVTEKGRNRITKVLDGCAIFEEFSGGPAAALEGRSYSVYDARAGKWKQTWVDNQGGYLDFVGDVVEGNRVFAREFVRQGALVKQRMVFRDVKPESFKWLWQASTDGGATWATRWEIDYRRVK
jgi:hypothetical protein